MRPFLTGTIFYITKRKGLKSRVVGLECRWEEGLRILGDIGDGSLCELKACAEGAYLHFQADYLQTKFSHHKREREKYKDELLGILREERAFARRLLVLIERQPAIGFEAANHYFYNDRNLIEKILQTKGIETELLQ